MAALKEKAITLLGSVSVNMNSAAATTVFTVPVGKVCRITHCVIRDTTGTLTGSPTGSVTGWRQTFAVPLLTSGTGFVVVYGADLTQYTEQAAGTAIQYTVGGLGGAFTATVDIFGYLTN